jgi:hypothetical protein
MTNGQREIAKEHSRYERRIRALRKMLDRIVHGLANTPSGHALQALKDDDKIAKEK